MAPVSLSDHLSDHDKMVLEAIFTPTQIGSDSSLSYNEDLPEELKGEKQFYSSIENTVFLRNIEFP